MVLFSKLYEREGNDAWLKDYIEIDRNPIGLYFRHTINHTGWNGDIKETTTFELNGDLVSSQQRIDSYLKNELLDDEFKINLEQIIYE